MEAENVQINYFLLQLINANMYLGQQFFRLSG